MSSFFFAYGALMDPTIIKRRRIFPLDAAPAVLHGWQLVFNFHGIPEIEPCFGNVQENSTSEVHGVLYSLKEVDLKNLLISEGAIDGNVDGYQPISLGVWTYGGSCFTNAIVLVVPPKSKAIVTHSNCPSTRYLKLLWNGARHFQLHPEYIAFLEAIPPHSRSSLMSLVVVLEGIFLLSITLPIWIVLLLRHKKEGGKFRPRNALFRFLIPKVRMLHCMIFDNFRRTRFEQDVKYVVYPNSR